LHIGGQKTRSDLVIQLFVEILRRFSAWFPSCCNSPKGDRKLVRRRESRSDEIRA